MRPRRFSPERAEGFCTDRRCIVRGEMKHRTSPNAAPPAWTASRCATPSAATAARRPPGKRGYGQGHWNVVRGVNILLASLPEWFTRFHPPRQTRLGHPPESSRLHWHSLKPSKHSLRRDGPVGRPCGTCWRPSERDAVRRCRRRTTRPYPWFSEAAALEVWRTLASFIGSKKVISRSSRSSAARSAQS